MNGHELIEDGTEGRLVCECGRRFLLTAEYEYHRDHPPTEGTPAPAGPSLFGGVS